MRVAAYLKENPMLGEIVCRMRDNYVNFGRLHGKCTMEAPSEELRFLVGRILADLTKKSYQDKGPLTFGFSTFFNRLNKVAGSNEKIEETLMEYFGTPVVTRPVLLSRQQEDFDLFLGEILMGCPRSLVDRMGGEIEAKGKVHALLKNGFKEDPGRASIMWFVIEAMWLWVIGQINDPKENLKLVVVSDLLTRDPHGFDKTSPYRRIFIYLLSLESGESMPGASSEKEQEFFSAFDIYTDLISSFISAYNLRDELGEAHPAKEGERRTISLWGPFADRGQAMNITLANLLDVKRVTAPGNVLIVENPSVFESLCPHVNKETFALICTHGNLNMALLKLLDVIIKTNPEIRLLYNGDFDLGGITIANSMLNRFESHLTLVHFDVATYLGISSAVILSKDKLLAKLGKVHPALAEITEAVANRGIACYQESIMDKLIEVIS